MSNWAAVLAGGSGTRFWPVSTQQLPKQFLPLGTSKPLLVEAIERLEGLIDRSKILIVTGERYAEKTRDLIPSIPAENVLAEPRPASTAPALAWATAEAARRDRDAAILSLHADWWVGDAELFRQTASKALDAARKFDSLVTVGMVPNRPETGCAPGL